MKQYPNFYENLKEALARLRGTVVVYDGLPYYVLTITNHKSDGIFRVYLDPVGEDKHPRPPIDNWPNEHPAIGMEVDEWMAANPNTPILRKMMNSPLFNKFRPYPMGMANISTGTYYLQRQPNRKMEQGLIRSMIEATRLTTSGNSPQLQVDLYTPAFKACVLATHPSAEECLKAMLDPSVENDAVAFHREFALVRGPIETIFFAYKTDVIGMLPKRNFDTLFLGKKFRHTKEVVAGLNLFSNIVD